MARTTISTGIFLWLLATALIGAGLAYVAYRTLNDWEAAQATFSLSALVVSKLFEGRLEKELLVSGLSEIRKNYDAVSMNCQDGKIRFPQIWNNHTARSYFQCRTYIDDVENFMQTVSTSNLVAILVGVVTFGIYISKYTSTANPTGSFQLSAYILVVALPLFVMWSPAIVLATRHKRVINSTK